jgi:8-hydroxy-5-deazaflavin:NADPH oxidoreductase
VKLRKLPQCRRKDANEMKVGVIGSGVVGQALGSGFLKHGHEVMLGTRNPDKPEVTKWVSANPGARVGGFQEAASFGDFVVLATLGTVAESALEQAGLDNLAGKTILDATNPLTEGPPEDGVLPFFTGPNESLGERVQAKAARSHVVKTFNSVGSAHMVNPRFEQGTPTMFLCGNDAQAKAQVEQIIRQFGWEPYDCGGIISSRALEPLCRLWCLPGFLRNDWSHAFKMLTK